MDFKDCEAHATDSFFWFAAKKQLIEILLDKIKPSHKLRLLDIGTGTGTNIEILKKFGEVYVTDTNPEALELISENAVIEKKLGDATKLPYPDKFFDAVTAFDVLEHIENDVLAVKEIKRVLKNDGFFIFTVPAFNFLFSSHDKALDHFRRYNKKEITNLLKDFGLITIGFWIFFLFIPIAFAKILAKKNPSPKMHSFKMLKILSAILLKIMHLENKLIKNGIKFPIGISIYGICKKIK